MNEKTKAREFGIEAVQILPPGEGRCPVCAAAHAPELPHNKDSLYYQMRFRQQHGRFPTWKDAAAHCSPEVERILEKELAKRRISIDVGRDDGS